MAVTVALLAALDAGVGLGPAALAAGAAVGAGTCAALSWGMAHAGAERIGPADRVTLTRAVLVAGVAALTVQDLHRPVPVGLLVTITAVALLLDAVDGQVARRTGTVSQLGARFDMEVDALLILVLSVHVARPVGGWVLLIGAMRYAFVAAGHVLPWLPGPLPPRFWRKVVAATQGVVLAVASAGVLPPVATTVAVAAALGLLVESFGRDVAHRWRHGRPARHRRGWPAQPARPTHPVSPAAPPRPAQPARPVPTRAGA